MAPNPPEIPSALSILTNRNKGLDSCQYGYKLVGNQYGLDVAIGDFDIDEKRMALRFPFADGNRRDGVGDLLEVGGIRTDRHQVNPIVLFDHGKECKLPIAKAEDPDTKAYTVQIDPLTRQAWVTAFFYQGKSDPGIRKEEDYDHAVFCEQLFDLAAKRYIRAGSIGYQVVKALKLPADYERGTPPGLHLLVTLMLEGSLVVLPANGDTVRKALALPNVCGKAMSPVLVKSLTPYAEPVKIMANGIGKGEKSQFRKLNFNVGDSVIWNSRTGPVEAEFRGQLMGMDGYEATIIVREDNSAPYQVTVPAMEIKVKSINDACDYVRSVARRFKGKGRYSLGAIEQELRKYQRPNDETYWDFAKRYMDNDSIERVWREETKSLNTFSPEQLRIGTAHEMEHTDDPAIAEQIAKDHLAEDPEYYTHLAEAGMNGKKDFNRITSQDRRNKFEAFAENWEQATPQERTRLLQGVGEPAQLASSEYAKLPNITRAILLRIYAKSQPSDSISPEKARQILKDGEVRGEPLTDKQRGMFGAAASKNIKSIRMKYRRKMGGNMQTKAGYTQAYMRGHNAGTEGVSKNNNPYKHEPEKSEWLSGYEKAASKTKSLRQHYRSKRLGTKGFDPYTIANEINKIAWDRGRPAADGVRVLSESQIQRIVDEFNQRHNVIDATVSSIKRGDHSAGAFGSGGIGLTYEGGNYRAVKIKSIQQKSLSVNYRNKLVKGVAEVQMKFATDHMPHAKQVEFYKEMEAAGYGKPGGRWSDDGKDLQSPLKKACFKFHLDPDQDLTKSLANATAIASKHGAKFLGSGQVTNTVGTKSMATHMRTKADPSMNGATDPSQKVPTDLNEQVEEERTEPIGAQALRRIHEHHLMLMEDYHEMLDLMEPDSKVKVFTEELLEGIEQMLEAVETLMSEQYPDLEPLEGVGDKDMDGVEMPGEEDEVPAEEAIEGMKEKRFGSKYLKKGLAFPNDPDGGGRRQAAIRMLERKLEMAKKDGDKARIERYEQELLDAKDSARPFKSLKSMCPGCDSEPCKCGKGEKFLPYKHLVKSISKVLGKDLTEEEAGEVVDKLQGEMDDTEVKSFLHPKHKDMVSGAAGFHGEAANHNGAWEDEHRMKAMGWHKALGEMTAGDEMPAEEASLDPNVDPTEETGGMPGEMGQKGWNIGDKVVVDKSGKYRGQEGVITEFDRKPIGSNAENVSQRPAPSLFVKMPDGNIIQVDIADTYKKSLPSQATKALASTFEAQGKAIADISKTLAQLGVGK